MTAFENIVVGKSSIPSLVITVILMILIPLIFFIYWRRKHKQQTNISYLIAGAVGFILSARVLELGVHYICILADNPVSRSEVHHEEEPHSRECCPVRYRSQRNRDIGCHPSPDDHISCYRSPVLFGRYGKCAQHIEDYRGNCGCCTSVCSGCCRV